MSAAASLGSRAAQLAAAPSSGASSLTSRKKPRVSSFVSAAARSPRHGRRSSSPSSASLAPPPDGGATEEEEEEADAAAERAKVSMVSLGCPKNTVDGEVMLGDLFANGFDVVDDHDESDAIIINTCGFVEVGKKEKTSDTSGGPGRAPGETKTKHRGAGDMGRKPFQTLLRKTHLPACMVWMHRQCAPSRAKENASRYRTSSTEARERVCRCS